MPATSRQIDVSRAAERFVRERQAQACLDMLVDITNQIFPDARHISADLHEDSDVAGVQWVVIRVEVPWGDSERARQARDDWYTRTATVCSPAELADFGLEIDRKPK
jgi:hypothetical protein